MKPDELGDVPKVGDLVGGYPGTCYACGDGTTTVEILSVTVYNSTQSWSASARNVHSTCLDRRLANERIGSELRWEVGCG